MRILLDFDIDSEHVPLRGVKFYDIAEFDKVFLIPYWIKGDNINRNPDKLYINLCLAGRPINEAYKGEYMLDGSSDAFLKAIVNYDNVVNKLLVNGYAKISDFENVDWY